MSFSSQLFSFPPLSYSSALRPEAWFLPETGGGGEMKMDDIDTTPVNSYESRVLLSLQVLALQKAHGGLDPVLSYSNTL